MIWSAAALLLLFSARRTTPYLAKLDRLKGK